MADEAVIVDKIGTIFLGGPPLVKVIIIIIIIMIMIFFNFKTIKILFTINLLEKKKKLFIQNTIYNSCRFKKHLILA